MEFKRLMAFAVIAMAILFGWNYAFPPPKKPVAQTQVDAAKNTNPAAAQQGTLSVTDPIKVKTDVYDIEIDQATGDIRRMVLSKHDATSDATKTFVLLDDEKTYTYVAQSSLLNKQGAYLLPEGTKFTAAQKQYDLGNSDKVEVRLTAPEANGVKVDKVYTFRKNDYAIDVRFDVTNNTGKPLAYDAMYRMLRDGSAPEGESWFVHSYTGPVVYTPEGKYQKVDFKSLDEDFQNGKDSVDYQRKTEAGWVGMIQHYFVTSWVLNKKDTASVCGKAENCTMDVKKRSDGLYSAGVRVALPDLAAGQTTAVPMTLFAGPAEYNRIMPLADNLELSKDFGKLHIFASPLFKLLNWIHGYVGNWGWAIILLTILVKAILFPLTNASYKSMAKMRAVAPRLTALKAEYGDDRMKMQQEMMALYKKEKINPLGGCLPMLLQIPVFLGLYWALFNSVELRQAPWMGWIQDLARPDHWFILPVLMAVTMWLQTHLNPPPADPMQAKMMKIMPLMFSVMFFFFPAGLVLYYVVNNVLSIAQQWFINKKIEKNMKAAA